MIHILHHQKDEIINWINHVKSDNHENSIENDENYNFILSVNESGAADVGSRSRILIPGEEGDYREFIVDYTFERTAYMEKEVYAKGSFIDIGKLKHISPQVLDAQTIQTAAGMVLSGLGWKVGIVEYSGIRKWTIETHMDAYEALKAISSLFDCELRFRVTVEGDQVTGRYVDFIKKQGLNRGKETVFGKDLIGITRKVYSDRIVTALHCIGPERQDGTRLEVTVEDDEAFQNWNWHGQHLTQLYFPETTDQDMTLERLTQLGETELKKRIAAAIEYEVEAASLEHIFGYEHEITRLGDTVKIKDEHFNPPMYLDSRVIFVDRSIFNKAKKSYKLGEVIEYKKEDVMKTWRELQALYATKVIKSPTAPPGKPNVIWIQTGGTVEVAHTWDIAQNTWIKVTPTEAIEVGAETPEGAQGKANTARDEAKTYTNQQLTNYVSNTTYQQDITEIQNQIDGNITSWFYAYDPSLSNAPANTWTTTDDKNTHLGDLFYNTSSGYAWRFALESGVYKWISVKDTDVTKALSDAAKAQDTADEKRRTFVAQPVPPYDIGDLWANGQTVYRCKVAKASGGSYAAGDWEIIGDVTNQNTSKDTSNVNGVPSTEVIGRISTAESSITQNANEIASRVKQTDVDNSINNIDTMTRLNGTELLDQSFVTDSTKNPFVTGLSGAHSVVPSSELGLTDNKNMIKAVGATYLRSDYLPNTIEMPFYFSVDVYNKGTTTGIFYLGVEFFDANKNSLGSNDLVRYGVTADASKLPSDVWTTFSGKMNPNDDINADLRKKATYIRLRILTRWNISGDTNITYLRNINLKQLGNNASPSLVTRMTTAESSIVQNANQIALKVSQTDYEGTSPSNLFYNTHYDKALTVSSSSLYQSKSAGIQSEFQDTYLYLEQSGTTELFAYLDRIPLKPAQKVTITVWVQADADSKGGDVFLLTSNSLDGSEANKKNTGYNAAFNINFQASGVWTKMQKTFTLPSDVKSGYIRFDHNGSNTAGVTKAIRIGPIMVQYGTIGTKWQPHMDEMATELQSRMSSAESSITQQATQMSQKVSQTDYNGNTIASLINQTATTILLQAAKIALDGYVEAKHIKSLNGLNINDQFMVDANGNVSMAGLLKAIGSSNYMQLSGDTLVAGGYTGAPVGGRTLLSVLSTIPNMFDGNYSNPEIKGHGKLYTHTARIWVPAQTFSTSAWVEYTLDLTGYDSVAIQVVSAVSLQSRAKEMYAYERVDGRYPSVGDLRRIVIRLSPHYNFTSPGFYVEVDVMILGWR